MSVAQHCSSQSPIMMGLGTPRSESPVVLINPLSPDRLPSSPKVTHCKNCRFSFRASHDAAEFCTKDCETCFTIFKTLPPPQNEDPAAIQEVKNEIYLFKRQLEMMDRPPSRGTSTPVQSIGRDSPVSMGIALSDSIDSPKTAAHKKASRFNWNMTLFRPSPEFPAMKKNVTV